MTHLTYLDLVAEPLPDKQRRLLSIDTEDYTTTVDSGLSETDLRRLPSNLAGNIDQILDAFAEKSYTCTFFILGRIADRIIPQIRRMVAEGHEISSHGMSHRRLLELTPEQVKIEMQDSKYLIEDLSGTEVKGFRAPMFSITNQNLWALDILVETGYQYDSSISPVSNFAYGIPEAPGFPHRLKNSLIELPMSVFNGFGYSFMVGGGFYLRAYPLWVHKIFLRMRKESLTSFYLHPWELDPPVYNLWKQMPESGKHWTGRPRLMKLIETFNRRNVLKKYLELLEFEADAAPPGTLGQVLADLNDELSK